MNTEADDDIYCVVMNHEEQYSIWPEWRELPAGWRLEGKRGSKQECLDHIDIVWTDMRPLSLRKLMDEYEKSGPAVQEDISEEPWIGLVERLSQGVHPVKISLRPQATPVALQRAIQDGVVLVTFTETQGQTELALEIDAAETDLSTGNFGAGQGLVSIVGRVVLDGTSVRCKADVDLKTMAGVGALTPTEVSI